MGRFAPLHSGLGFRLIGNGLLLLLLVHLCLGDDHTTSHLASLPQIRPVAHFAQGVTLPCHKRRRLPDENSSDDERESSAGLLLPDEEEGDEEDCRPASLALLLDYIMSKFPAASKPLARPSNRLPDENSSDHGRNSSAGLLQPDEEEGEEGNCRPASLALLLDYIMSKFPATSKPLARPSNRLPDENSSDHGRNSSAGLQPDEEEGEAENCRPDEEEGDAENCRPASLALLLDYIMSKFPVAPKPLAQPSTRRFHVFGAAGFVQESSQRSSNISWFDHVQFACAPTQSKFETRFYERKSLSSIMPSVSKVMYVSLSPCQEWGLKVISQRYDLMSSKPSDISSVPMSVRDAAVLERTLRSALESYNFQLRMMTALFRFSGDSGQIPLELWPL